MRTVSTRQTYVERTSVIVCGRRPSDKKRWPRQGESILIEDTTNNNTNPNPSPNSIHNPNLAVTIASALNSYQKINSGELTDKYQLAVSPFFNSRPINLRNPVSNRHYWWIYNLTRIKYVSKTALLLHICYLTLLILILVEICIVGV